MTWKEMVKEEASNLNITLSDAYINYILWEETGFPDFWDIPNDGNTPEECCRKQVRKYLTSNEGE